MSTTVALSKAGATKERINMDAKQTKVMKTFMSLYTKNKEIPSIAQMKKNGVTREQIRQTFTSMSELDTVARELYPNKFYDEDLSVLFNKKEHKKKINAWASKYNRFVITTAVTGCQVDKKFLASIENYCKKNKAQLLVLTCSDTSKRGGVGTVDKLVSDNIVPGELYLNDNLFISSLKMSAKQIDPSRSVSRIAKSAGTVVYGSPKQMLKVNATAQGKFPSLTIGTGAVTVSSYDTDKYMSERTSYLADLDHVVGALVVEIQDNTTFHQRHIQATRKGSFIDLDTQYNPDGTTSKVTGSALVLGDWHSGETDPTAAKAWHELATLIKPKYLFLHDVFNGSSISHHESRNKIVRAKKAELNDLSLEKEIKGLVTDLDMLSKWAEKVIIVGSNHDDWVSRYIKDGRFLEDPQNTRLGFQLGLAMMDNKNPLKYATHELYGCKANNVKWLDVNDSFIFGGRELGDHGHLGPNGSRGSLASLEKSLGGCVIGHSHTPGILRNSIQVGTTSYLQVAYNQGPSGWLHASAIVHNNGCFQLIISINGDWRS
jgi:hypothetical protein